MLQRPLQHSLTNTHGDTHTHTHTVTHTHIHTRTHTHAKMNTTKSCSTSMHGRPPIKESKNFPTNIHAKTKAAKSFSPYRQRARDWELLEIPNLLNSSVNSVLIALSFTKRFGISLIS